jgi:hypothetical protein
MVLLLALAPVPLAAQRVPLRAGADSTMPQHAFVTRHPWTRPLASMLLPGSGQLAAGQSRGIIYLALEAWLVSSAITEGHTGQTQRNQYQDLAFDIARRPFVTFRIDGPWDYYESMEKFVESGRYDLSSGPIFAPETDTTTFNGFTWQLARRTFFPNPDSTPDIQSAPYQAALNFYKARAVADAFRWSWRGARLEQDVYRQAILTSDNAFRARTNYLGALVLNHLSSAIDALISTRMGHGRALLPRVHFSGDPHNMVLLWTGSF